MITNSIPDSEPQSAELASKRERLLALLEGYRGVVVAFSGGVDSSVVAKAAVLALKDRALAVTADSPSLPREELEHARQLAQVIGIRHLVLPTQECDNPDYVKNDGRRCYYCKSELYSQLSQLLPQLGLSVVVSGANRDDLGDYRPGLIAAEEHGVRHPLQEAGLTKAEVRALAASWGLPNWSKPASPCLSSRLAPGVAVTPERLQRIERAEELLHAWGLAECRIRYHEGDLARVEVPLAVLAHLAAEPLRTELTRALHALGFTFVTLDLDGFRSGSLNELVPLEMKNEYMGRSASSRAVASDLSALHLPRADLTARDAT